MKEIEEYIESMKSALNILDSELSADQKMSTVKLILSGLISDVETFNNYINESNLLNSEINENMFLIHERLKKIENAIF